MSKYDALDKLILDAVTAGAQSFGEIESTDAGVEAKRLYAEDPKGKPPFRHIDSRLQALRKKGLIEFSRSSGWKLGEQA